jgi:TctA family transporter
MPGPDMLDKHLVLTFSMVWTMVVANIITVAFSLLFLNYLAKLTLIRGTVLIPFILFFSFIGAYTSNNHLGDLLVLLVFGFLGYLMIKCGWPRAPLVLGFVLGRIAENNFYINHSLRPVLDYASVGPGSHRFVVNRAFFSFHAL